MGAFKYLASVSAWRGRFGVGYDRTPLESGRFFRATAVLSVEMPTSTPEERRPLSLWFLAVSSVDDIWGGLK